MANLSKLNMATALALVPGAATATIVTPTLNIVAHADDSTTVDNKIVITDQYGNQTTYTIHLPKSLVGTTKKLSELGDMVSYYQSQGVTLNPDETVTLGADGTTINISGTSSQSPTHNYTIAFVDEDGKTVGTVTVSSNGTAQEILQRVTVPDGYQLGDNSDIAIPADGGTMTVHVVKATTDTGSDSSSSTDNNGTTDNSGSALTGDSGSTTDNSGTDTGNMSEDNSSSSGGDSSSDNSGSTETGTILVPTTVVLAMTTKVQTRTLIPVIATPPLVIRVKVTVLPVIIQRLTTVVLIQALTVPVQVVTQLITVKVPPMTARLVTVLTRLTPTTMKPLVIRPLIQTITKPPGPTVKVPRIVLRTCLGTLLTPITMLVTPTILKLDQPLIVILTVTMLPVRMIQQVIQAMLMKAPMGVQQVLQDSMVLVQPSAMTQLVPARLGMPPAYRLVDQQP